MDRDKMATLKSIGIDVADSVKALGIGFVAETALVTLLAPVWAKKKWMMILGTLGVTAVSGAVMSVCHKDDVTMGDVVEGINDIVEDTKEDKAEFVTE